MGAWLLLAHAAAFLSLPFAGLPVAAVPALGAAVTASLLWYWPRHASRTAPDCVRALSWEGDGSCHLEYVDGAACRATLYRQAFVQPWLVILQLEVAGRRRSLVILPDMLDPATFRRLRVRLRMELDRGHAR